MNEVPRIYKWIQAALLADVPLRAIIGTAGVYADRIPAKAAFPLALFNFQSPGGDVAGNGPVRLMARPEFQVKMVGKGPLSQKLQDGSDRIDEILQNVAAVTFDGIVISARRLSPVAYAEGGADADQQYFHLGGIYRFDAYKA